MFFPGLYSKQNYFQGDEIGYIFYQFLISAFLGEDKFICVRWFEIIGEYSAAVCTRSGAFLEQVIATNSQDFTFYFWCMSTFYHKRIYNGWRILWEDCLSIFGPITVSGVYWPIWWMPSHRLFKDFLLLGISAILGCWGYYCGPSLPIEQPFVWPP